MSEQKRVMDADPPERMRNLRACLSCKLVKTYDQFVNDGCENCPDYQRVQRFTTPTFHGLIAMTDPNKSWVAKWQTQGMHACVLCEYVFVSMLV